MINTCENCGGSDNVELRDIFYVDWFGNIVYTNEQKCMCDNCWSIYCLNAD